MPVGGAEFAAASPFARGNAGAGTAMMAASPAATALAMSDLSADQLPAGQGTDPGGSRSKAPNADGLGRRIALSAAIMIGTRLAIRAISVVSTLLLVRLLVSADFGLVALAGASFTIIELLTSINIGLALVRARDPDPTLYDTAWTLQILRGVGLAAIVVITSGLQADLLGDARVQPLLCTVALTVVLDSFTSIGMAKLQREMRFDRIFRQLLLAKVSAFLICILLAWLYQNYWCLVLGNLAAKLATVPYSYWLAPHRPRLSLKGARELLNFSKWMMAFNACLVTDDQAPILGLGHFAGLGALGLYQVAYQVAAVPVTEIAVPIRSPVYAGLANAYHDAARLRAHVLAGFGFMAAIVTPMSVGLALVAPELAPLALGEKWADAGPLMALCALYALVDALSQYSFNVFIVLGRQGRQVLTYLGFLALRVPLVLYGAQSQGALGVAAALFLTGIVGTLVWNFQMIRLIGACVGQWWGEIWRTLAAASAMSACLLSLGAWSGVTEPVTAAAAWPRLLLYIPAGGLVHVATQVALWSFAGRPEGPEARALRMVAGALQRLRSVLSRRSPVSA